MSIWDKATAVYCTKFGSQNGNLGQGEKCAFFSLKPLFSVDPIRSEKVKGETHVFQKINLVALALAGSLAVHGQTIQPPYSSNYTLVSLGPVAIPTYYGSLTFQGAATLLITSAVEGSSVIYAMPVIRGISGHITGLEHRSRTHRPTRSMPGSNLVQAACSSPEAIT